MVTKVVPNPIGIETQSQVSRHPAIPLLVFGAASGIYVQVLGRVSLAEMLAVLGLVGALRQQLRAPSHGLWLSTLAILIGLLVGPQIVPSIAATDSDLLRALANYALVAAMAAYTAFLLKRFGVIYAAARILLGYAIGQVAGYVLTPTASILIDPWKFGIGSSVTICVLIVADRLRGAGLGGPSMAFLVALALTHFALGWRSAGLMVLIIVLLPIARNRQEVRGVRSSWKTLIIGVALALFATRLYEWLAGRGLFGSVALDKLQYQTGDLGLLFGARKELPLLALSWSDSPWVGWGADANVPASVRSEAASWFSDHNYLLSYSDRTRLFEVIEIPLHSVALGLMVQVGLFALPFILVSAKLLVRGLRVAVSQSNYLMMFASLTGVSHFLFSPLGDTTRFPFAFALALGLTAVMTVKSVPVSASER